MGKQASSASLAASTASQIRKLLQELPEDRADAARLDELRRLFAGLIQNGQLELATNSDSAKDHNTAKHKYQTFLRTSHQQLVQQLCNRIALGKRTAVRTLWGVVASAPCTSHNGVAQHIDTQLLTQWIRSMTTRSSLMEQTSVQRMIQAEFLQPFVDVQYYTCVAVAGIGQELYQTLQKQQDTDSSVAEKAEGLLQLLLLIPMVTRQQELDAGGYLFPPPAATESSNEDDSAEGGSSEEEGEEEEEDSYDEEDSSSEEEEEPPVKKQRTNDEPHQRRRFAYEQIRAHHRVLSKAWLTLLKLPLPTRALKQALLFLPQHVLPHVPNPLRFADFFMTAYDSVGGVVPILALDGLFLLIVQHGLEYKNFYKQLYRLVTPSLLYVKYQTRFIRLLDKSLSRNDLLPAHVVAAFCKRLLRCALMAPPGTILVCLALVSNWLRQHPETACLIHRDDEPIQDAFDAAADNPEDAHALQSSLWELRALEHHSYHAVVTLAKSVGRLEELKTPLHSMDAFGQSYQTLMEQERKRQRKRKTALTFTKPSSLFSSSDIFSSILAVPRNEKQAEAEE